MVYSGKKRAGASSYNLVTLSKRSRSVPLGMAIAKAAAKRYAAPLASRGFRGSYGSKGEMKYSDIATNTVAVNTTGSFSLLHIPILGSDFNARIGRKTLAKSVYIRGIWGSDVLGSIGAQQVRMVLFVDYQPNGLAPTVLQVLSTAVPTSHLAADNRDRFKILCDKEFAIGPQNVATPAFSSPVVQNIKLYKKLNLQTIFNATNGGTIADITTGALYLFFIGSAAAGNGDGACTWSSRVRYADV